MSVSIPVVHLCIPQLLQSLELWGKDFLFEPVAPELGQLLRQFETIENKSIHGLDASLFNAVGMVGNQELPVAHYRYQTHKNVASQKTQSTLLCADPIHLEVGMNDITLTDIINDLTQDEAEEILSDLNKHFQQDGLEFVRGSNQHWYVVLPGSEAITTTPLNEAFRKNIANFQPSSSTRKWQVIQNESQMILHSCSVNQQREMAGLPTVNSLWFWGGGQAIKPSDKLDVVSVYWREGAETSAKMVANVTGCECATINNELPSFKAGKSLVILNALFSPAMHDNIDLFQQELSKLDENIIKPLKQAWQIGKIELLIDSCDGRILKPRKPKAWKFWGKKPVSLTLLTSQK